MPQRDKKLISITVNADPAPPKLLFATAGSGITPVMAMLYTLQKRGQHSDIVHIHSARNADEVIFHDELRVHPA